MWERDDKQIEILLSNSSSSSSSSSFLSFFRRKSIFDKKRKSVVLQAKQLTAWKKQRMRLPDRSLPCEVRFKPSTLTISRGRTSEFDRLSWPYYNRDQCRDRQFASKSYRMLLSIVMIEKNESMTRRWMSIDCQREIDLTYQKHEQRNCTSKQRNRRRKSHMTQGICFL